MAVIRIKRSAGLTAPASLEHGELAITIDTSNAADYSNLAGRLFVGNSDGDPVVIGGEYNARLLDHQPGLLTPNSAVIVGAAGTIDSFNVTGIVTAGTLVVGVQTSDNLTINENISVGSSITVGVSTVGQNFYALSDGTTNVYSLIHSGLTTDSRLYPVLYINENNVVTTTNTFAWIDEAQQLYSDGDVAAGRTSFGLAGIFTTGRIENLVAGVGSSTYSFPTTRAVSAGQILVSDANGVLGFATNDQRLNFIANEFTGSVGLGSESLNILGGQNINTVATGAGLTVTINLTDDVLVGGAMTVTGDFTVNGNITYLSSTITQIEDKNIELAVPEVGSPADSTADGGGITVKGDSDYQIVWSNSRDAFTVNQGWEPLSDNALSLGSTSVQWKYIFGRNAVFENLSVTGLGTVANLSISGVGTFTSIDINGGTINNTTIGIGTSTIGNFTTLGFLTAFGERATVTDLRVTGISTVASLAFTDADRNGVAYAGTSNIVGFSSSPSAGISTSTYILTSLGIGTADIPVWTDTIDCGTY